MSNHIVADLISRLNVASKGHLKSIDVLNTKFSFNILDILYKNGLISRFYVLSSRIRVYFKYHQNRIVFYQLKLISRPGCKVFWGLGKLSTKFSVSSFCGFYIISTNIGLMTSNDCLLGKRISGEVLIKVSI